MASDSGTNTQPEDQDAAGIAEFAFELGVLKRMRRAGWWHVGVRDPESVAEHSLRVAQLAALIAAQEGADPARAAFLAIWHDSQETRIGDIPHTAKPYLASSPSNETITADQVARMPDAAGKTVREAVAEYEAQSSAEAHCTKDADKLECLIQAIEYRAAGYQRVQGWIDSSRKSLTTETARRIADAALTTSTLAWRDR
ncbi:MAG: HD domain-containing protein [Sciscionella sp.]